MRFQNLLLGLLPQLLALPALAQCSTAALEPLAPALTYLFTTHVNVGKALAPITVMDGLEIVEPLLPGTVSGPALNGTITGGTAWPTIVKNSTLNVAQLNIFSKTTDGVSFFVSGKGIGTVEQQFVKLKLDISGKYVLLAGAFAIAELLPNKQRTVVTVNGFKVGK